MNMKSEILESNETGFNIRYGISLQKMYKDAVESNRYTDSIISGYEKILREAEGLKFDFTEDGSEGSFLFWAVVGFSDGRFLRKVLENIPGKTKVVVYEPDELFFLFLCSIKDISDLIGDPLLEIFFLTGKSGKLIEDHLKKNIGFSNYKYVKCIISPGAEIRYHDLYEEVQKEIDNIVNSMEVEYATISIMDELLCKNELYALTVLDKNSTFDQFIKRIPDRKVPIIIVAAGPSLDKNAEMLRKAKGRALIITVSHAVKTLDKRGIDTDLVAVLDPKPGGFLRQGSDKHKLIISACADVESQKRYVGECIYYDFQNYLGLECLNNLPEWKNGGSVATDMLGLFIHEGFKTFILVGQDLAYSREGYTHAGDEKEVSHQNNSRTFTKDIYGEIIETRGDWERYRQEIEEYISGNKNIKVIDATEGGAFINGTEIMTLADAIQVLCDKTYPVRDWLRDIPKAQTAEEARETGERLKYIRERTKLYGNKCSDMIKLGEKIREAYIAGRFFTGECAADCQRYDFLYSWLMESRDGKVLRFYSNKVIEEYLRDAMQYESDEDIEKKLSHEIKLFKRLYDNSEKLYDYMGILLCEKEKV